MRTYPLIEFCPNAFKRSRRIKPLPKDRAEEFGAMLLTQARIVVRKRAFIPDGMDFDDVVSEVWMLAWDRIQKYRKTNAKKSLREFAYMSAYFALIDWGRAHSKNDPCIRVIALDDIPEPTAPDCEENEID